MLTPEGCASRRKRFWEVLPEGFDVAIISDPSHLTYLVGYAPSPFTFRTSGARALLVLKPDSAVLVADNLLEPFCEPALVDEVHVPTWYDGRRSAPPRLDFLVQSTLEIVRRDSSCRKFAVESSSLPLQLVDEIRARTKDARFVDTAEVLRTLRRAKDPDELELLGRSMRAMEAGQAAALERVEPGMTEFQVYQIVESACLAQAGERAIVYGDFVSGPRAPQSLGPPTHRRLEPGDLFILDFSVVLHGYRGDFANTVCVGRNPCADQRDRFEGCMAAIAAGEAALRPGVPAREVDAAVRKAFLDRGFSDFPSHSGHGVGLKHPESPYIVPESHDILQEGDVVTLEPGQYDPSFGGMRFERNYRITSDGFEQLSRHRLSLVGD